MQIVLTFRNNPSNVKRRVLHTRGFAMCYITKRALLISNSEFPLPNSLFLIEYLIKSNKSPF